MYYGRTRLKERNLRIERLPIFHLLLTSDDLVLDDQSDLYSLPPDSQSEVVEEEDFVNPYPITFPVRKISVPTKLVSKERRNEEKTGKSTYSGAPSSGLPHLSWFKIP